MLLLYLMLLALGNIPVMQRWSARQLAQWLSKRMDTEVEIASMRLLMLNRVVIDGVRIYDRQDTLMLDVARLAAKVELLPLMQKTVRIDNAQLFGAHTHLYKESGQGAFNFAFMLDALASKDSTSSTRLDLRLDKLLVRGMSLRFDIHDQPETPGRFNPSHLHLTDMRLNATLRHCTPDSINLELERLALQEQSGLALAGLNMNAAAGKHGLQISDTSVELPHSILRIPRIELTYDSLPEKNSLRKWLTNAACEGSIQASVTPSDIRAVVPALQHFDETVNLSLAFSGEKGTINVQDISLGNADRSLEAQLQGSVYLMPDSAWGADAQIKTLEADERCLPWFTRNLKGRESAPAPILQRLGHAKANGTLHYADQTLHADMEVHAGHGKARIGGTLRHMNELEAHLTVEQLQANRLLSANGTSPLEELAADVRLKGFVKGEDKKPQLEAEGTIERMVFKNYPYRNMPFAASCKGDHISLIANHEDTNGRVKLDVDLQNPAEGGNKQINCALLLADVDLHAMNLTSGMEGERISMQVSAGMEGTSADHINGQLQLDGLRLESEKEGAYTSDRLTLSLRSNGQKKRMEVESPFLNANVDGSFHWKDLYPSLRQMVHTHLPQLIPADSTARYDEEMDLQLTLQDTALIRRIAGIEMKIPQPATLSCRVNSALSMMQLQLQSPALLYGGETLKDIDVQATNRPEMMQGTLNMRRIMKQRPIDIRLEAFAGYNKLRSVLRWDNNRAPTQKGSIDITGTFYKDADGTPMVQGNVSPTDIIISDTLWKVHPASIVHRGGVTSIQHLGISQDKRHLNIGGTVSREESDTVTVDLNQINLAYIFQMINFKSLEFSGNATGRIYARSLLTTPKADAFLQVEEFRMNQSYMGEMDVHAGWGHAGKSIQLDADIRDAGERSHTLLQGTITPGHDPGSGLDLHINARRINLAFLNKYTSAIFTGLQGRATGTARVYGPFKQIDLEGDLVAEEASMKVNMLGTTYRMYNDSVLLRPGNIMIRHATAYDDYGTRGGSDHNATVDGRLMHNHLSNLRYEFNIEARNLLSYDFRDFGDQTFYGTFFASGNVHLYGQPGELTVDVNATPQTGSLLVYNVGSPETITEASFITFATPSDSVEVPSDEIAKKKPAPQEEEEANDIRLNMDLDITPQATVKLLMDPKSGDHILLGGNGHIRAHYYNKGKFQMYGVYRVASGVYKLSLQDFIHKDFAFREGSTITFGGDAFQAALNLQAIYTVPNVSLDDLSTSTLGLSNTRVDCVMNITGRASAPAVSFDFDLPGANEDEKQMVRSMVSTEEEKNMQAMYLLGIGRFYNNSTQFASGSNQGSMAMNSLISSTLSSQFNQMMSNMVGSSNWTFGANLRTGETGWNELDVEGMLSGRLLGNRLLLNGNFGYRESVYSNNNFIGDFDVKYLITPGGTVALRAYNETNDRYFIQSSLTTQGIGIQFKKDFNRWRDIFRGMGGKRKKRKR